MCEWHCRAQALVQRHRPRVLGRVHWSRDLVDGISIQILKTAVSFLLLNRGGVARAARPTQDQRPRAWVTRVDALRRVTCAGLRQPTCCPC